VRGKLSGSDSAAITTRKLINFHEELFPNRPLVSQVEISSSRNCIALLHSLWRNESENHLKPCSEKFVTDINYCLRCSIQIGFSFVAAKRFLSARRQEKMLHLNLLLARLRYFSMQSLFNRSLQLNGELSRGDAVRWFFYYYFRYVQAIFLNCETINSESMCILIKEERGEKKKMAKES
jgi:ferritin-like protein